MYALHTSLNAVLFLSVSIERPPRLQPVTDSPRPRLTFSTLGTIPVYESVGGQITRLV